MTEDELFEAFKILNKNFKLYIYIFYTIFPVKTTFKHNLTCLSGGKDGGKLTVANRSADRGS